MLIVNRPLVACYKAKKASIYCRGIAFIYTPRGHFVSLFINWALRYVIDTDTGEFMQLDICDKNMVVFYRHAHQIGSMTIESMLLDIAYIGCCRISKIDSVGRVDTSKLIRYIFKYDM